MTRKMREGDVLVVVRVPRGHRPPPGFKHSDAAIGTHHGQYSTHATRLIRKGGDPHGHEEEGQGRQEILRPRAKRRTKRGGA
ncbi:MAG: hypothetical protein ING29_12970 [Azospirillum sp.]|nr:hypothetical protein [Azospirillum sp.]